MVETVRQHMEMQERVAGFGIKVLSLFFIDRVANYTSEQGIIRKLFDAAFLSLDAATAKGWFSDAAAAGFAPALGTTGMSPLVDASLVASMPVGTRVVSPYLMAQEGRVGVGPEAAGASIGADSQRLTTGASGGVSLVDRTALGGMTAGALKA